MPRPKALVFAVLSMALSGALAPAQAQTVAYLAVQAGNGQVACQCLATSLESFQPISVKATDSRGNPVAGATITWTVTGGQMTLGGSQATAATTVTGTDGVSTIPIGLVVQNNATSVAVPYLVNTIQVAANNSSVVFTETQSLRTTQGNSVIQASDPRFNGLDLGGATLSAPVGATLSTPIQMQVTSGSAGPGVANVSVRIVNDQTSPALSCANQGGYADPGSVLTDANGGSSCYPVFNGSGTGTFHVAVGGVPAPNFATASYLQAFGTYTFTSIPGAPAAIQIVSGNNQIGAQGQALNPLVAQLVDANGNPVQNQTVTWTVTPAGAAALTNAQTVTDNNGEVAANASLYPLAASGALITVALASNAAISVAFQATLAGSVTSLTKVSGDGQSAQPGTNFSQPLVVQVKGPNGPVANYPVQFLINGPVSLPGGSTVDTNANGQVALTVKAGAITGTATVTAVAGALLTQTFTLAVTSASSVTPNGMTIVSGNAQSAIFNTMFAVPLVVEVNSAAGPVAGYVVSFSATGPIAISSGAATTNAAGQAQITVQAGATAGAATVTASASAYSVTFNLTVLPPGPAITASSFLNAASRVTGAISPCGLAILSAPGLTPDGTSDLSLAPLFGRLPHAIHGLSVTFGGVPAPIVSVAMGATNPEVTLQVPCEVTPGPSVPVTVNVGGASTTLNVPVETVSPGIFQMAMSDGVVRAVVVRDDGSFADVGGTDAYDPENPARRGENVRIYATGLGPTLPLVFTDDIQNPNADLIGFDATVASVVQAGIVGFGGLQVVSARQAPDLIGIYEVQVLLPSGAPTGNSVPIAISVVPIGANSAVSSNVSLIPIQ